MPRTQRISNYIQQLAYQSLVNREEADERPDDAPRAPDAIPNFAKWNETAFSGYVPFKSPSNR